MWKWFHGFKLLSFSHTRLREILIIIIHNTIKTIWPIFKKLTQCVETNLVWHRRRDDWIFGVKLRRSQGAVYREDIHSIFFFFWIVMIDGSDFQVPWVTPLAQLFWIKVKKKKYLMHHNSGFYFFCSITIYHFIKLCEIYTYAFHVLVINKSLILFSLPDNSESFIRFI